MKLIKRILASTMALSMILPLVACGNTEEEESQVDKVTVSLPPEDTASEGDLFKLGDDVQKTIKWMADYDLNPGIGGERSVALTLFEDHCGGKIEYIQTTYATKFDDLATAIIGDNASKPDIFPYHWLAFPYQVSKEMYQPITDLVDFDSPLWNGVKSTADQYVLDGEYYVAPLHMEASALIVYDKNNIEEIGAEDPYELYLNGNWNWNTFRDIATQWSATSTEENQRYGFNGWYAVQFVNQTGKTMVSLTDDGKFVNNTADPDIERAESFIYNLAKDGLVLDTWKGSAKDAFNTGVLFYSMGEWAFTGNSGPGEEDNWGVVPIPSDPNTDGKYTNGSASTYMWVKGSTANDAVKAWLNCNRIAETDEQYAATDKDKFFSQNPYWTEEMYQVKKDVISEDYTLIFEYGYGVSSKLSDDDDDPDGACTITRLYRYVTTSDEGGSQLTWAQVRDTYSPIVDAELADLNAALDALGL